MKVVSERAATPREIAEEIDEPINNVSYHLQVLKRLDCVELVTVRSARGGRVAEHVYRASERPFFDDDAWAELSDSDRMAVTAAVMQEISKDIAEAMAGGTFSDPFDNHISRSPLVLDNAGWKEVVDLLCGTMEALQTIQERVVERDSDESETMLAKVEIIHFQSPRPPSSQPQA